MVAGRRGTPADRDSIDLADSDEWSDEPFCDTSAPPLAVAGLLTASDACTPTSGVDAATGGPTPSSLELEKLDGVRSGDVTAVLIADRILRRNSRLNEMS